MTKIEKLIFHTLLFLVPSNLGYHYVQTWSYVNGILIDYLIPTLYLQDVLVFGLVITWFYKTFTRDTTFNDQGWSLRWLFLFLFSVFISVFASVNLYASVYAWVRLILYATFSLYILYNFDFKKEWASVLKVLSISFFLVSLLGLGQWFRQGAVFNNYLVFGEQPYNSTTAGIAREHMLGTNFIPIYGTFRHPNVYAGVLSVFLIWLFVFICEKNAGHFYKAVFALGILNLFLTFSYVAMLSFVMVVGLYFAIKRYKERGYKLMYGIIIIAVLFSLFLPLFSRQFFSQYPSFYRRAFLYETSLQYLKEGYIFGTGYNTSTEYAFENLSYFGEMRYLQPVHNIFVLLLVESGIFALLFFTIFLISVFRKLGRRNDVYAAMFALSLFHLVFLGLFDHYLLTIHQANLLLWLTLGFYFAYNESLL